MHQQPAQAPRGPNKVSKSDHRSGVSGWKASGLSVEMDDLQLGFMMTQFR